MSDETAPADEKRPQMIIVSDVAFGHLVDLIVGLVSAAGVGQYERDAAERFFIQVNQDNPFLNPDDAEPVEGPFHFLAVDSRGVVRRSAEPVPADVLNPKPYPNPDPPAGE